MTLLPDKPEEEQGFVLISAVWLLLLGAAIVAAIQLTVLHRAKTQAFDRQQLERQLALESGYETAVADILFNGPRSSFATLPATANYNLNGVAMTVTVSNEGGKLDVNQADPALIERALHGLGVEANARMAFIGELSVIRLAGRTLQSMPDLEAALHRAGFNIGAIAARQDRDYYFCASQYLTTYSGLSQPLSGQMLPELAKAINVVSVAGETGFQPGSALQVVVETPDNAPLKAVVRITGRLDAPVAVLDWGYERGC